MGLFGFSSPKPAPASEGAGYIFDSTTADFEERVLKASMEKPVLADFWAPWCGPCKQLMPLLEAEVQAAGGAVLLAKINIDDNPDLAQMLRIQSVPTVLAFFQGQPVTGFSGARPPSEIKNLIAQLIKLSRSALPDAIDIPAALKQAADRMAAGEYEAAQDTYLQILGQDENNAEAYGGVVRCLIAADALDQAKAYVDAAPEMIAKTTAFTAIKSALSLAFEGLEKRGALPALEKKLQGNPDDLEARFDLAAAQFAAGAKEVAIENLLEIMRKDRGWRDGAAHKELLKYFEALGFADPLAIQGRKKLSRLLFS